ncbi:hypothetical protein PSHT_10324 [Puccinia striiformis]|uniref:Uncharacterized protein n=1 Tax=Puccinia striiformis TaxID=27350 RepID=A0A2S4VAH9_9BASI|nr:hypothetical protein PSHT_10324 [Puccinia striiformis]
MTDIAARYLSRAMAHVNPRQSQQSDSPAPSPHVDQTAAPTSTKSYTFPPNLRIFCRTQIREVLLRPVIEAYTRRMAERNHVENWPIPMAKVRISM